MRGRTGFASIVALGVLAAAAGCNGPSSSPASPTSAALSAGASAVRPAARCENVAAEGTAPLGFIGGALGGLPSPLTIAGISGTLQSVITSATPSGSQGQGALHVTLTHVFESPEGTFTTDDRAVCAPAGQDPNVCRVNDTMRIVSGTGVFENASGQLQNHGIINLNTFTLTYSLRGRVCGDGL